MFFKILIFVSFFIFFYSVLEVIYTMRLPPFAYKIRIFVGLPGAGKTTLAAAFAKNRIKKGIPVFSNTPIKGTYKVERNDFGTFEIEDCEIEIDEAGITFNNRVFLDPHQIEWFKLHRHKHTAINLFSQRSDCEITIRQLSYELYLVRRSLIPFFVTFIRYPMHIGPNDTRDNVIPYLSEPRKVFDTFRVFAPSVWKLFDSWDAPRLRAKDFVLWDNVSENNEVTFTFK